MSELPVIITRSSTTRISNVIVAVPDHWHKQVTVDALSAGKDVYCEKPMSHSIADGEAMVRAVKGGNKFVQVGSQRVSSPLFVKAKSLFDAGAIGDLLQIELQLGRNSPRGAWQYPVPPDLSPTTLEWETWQGAVAKKSFDPSPSPAGAASTSTVPEWPAT